MSRLGIVHDPRFLLHQTGNHPEQPARLPAIEARLRESGLWNAATLIAPAPAFREDILRAHDEAMVDGVLGLSVRPPGYLDDYTVFSRETANVALLAAGAAMTAVREIMAGAIERAFVLVRPPGHHAARSTPMGFCFFNPVAVAARFLDHQYGIARVAILDFDAHHGNGTQDIFYANPNVFFCSIHEDESFPFRGGKASERGEGEAEGTTLNVPLPSAASRDDYLRAFEPALEALFAFDPEFLFLSAGFDAHRLDPLSGLSLESEDFGEMTRRILDRAKGSRIRGVVSVLEGGYHLRALAESVEAHVKALLTGG